MSVVQCQVPARVGAIVVSLPCCSIPAVLLDHVRHLNDELPLLVLLAALECLLLWGWQPEPPQGPGHRTCAMDLGSQGNYCGFGVPAQWAAAGLWVTKRDLRCRGLSVPVLCLWDAQAKGLGCQCDAQSQVGGARGTHVFPAQGGFAVLAEDVSHRVKPSEQQALFGRATAHINPAPDRVLWARLGMFLQPSPGQVIVMIAHPTPPSQYLIPHRSTHTELNR